MAPTAWAPPSLKMRSTPAILAATRITGAMVPSGAGGVVMTTCSTPASLAGMASMSTVEG